MGWFPARPVERTGPDVEVGGLDAVPGARTKHCQGGTTERHGDALEAFQESCKVVSRRQRDANEQASRSALGGQVGDWRKVCAQACSVGR